MQCGSYEFKLQRSKGYFLIYFTSKSTCLILQISYNPILNGRSGQGSFFFHCILGVNLAEMSHATSCMTRTSKANFGRTCRDFSALNTRMNVLDNGAYQSVMPSNAFVNSSNMQGGSCSNINLHTWVTKWSDSCMITALKPHSDNN